MARHSYPATFWIAITGSLLGSLLFGYQVGVLNTSLGAVANELNYHEEGVISSAVVLGAAIGSLCAGHIADTIGPRRAQILNVLPFLAGTVLCCMSPWKHVGFLLGRIITGFGAGAASLYTPRYVAEIAPASLRGNLGSQHQVCINIGILLAYMAGAPYETGFKGLTVAGMSISWWRVMIALSAIPALSQLVLMMLSPESPVWLSSQRQAQAAHTSCRKLWGRQDNQAEPLLADDQGQQAAPEGWGALARREYRWMVLLAVGLPVLQQASGINTVIYYSSKVFAGAGLRSPILGSIIMGLVNVLFTLVAAHLMDHWGRRPLLLISFTGMAACLVGVASTDLFAIPATLQGPLTVALINLYVLAFALGCGPIPWLYLSEILPSSIKGPTAALGTSTCWVGNLVVTLTFTPMLGLLGLGGSYLVYALLNVGAIAFVWCLVVETKCKTLAEIERQLLLPAEAPAAAGVAPAVVVVEEGVSVHVGQPRGKERTPSLEQWTE